MKEFFSHIRGALVSTLVLAVVCCGFYPLIVFGIAQAFFHDKANGSLIVDPGGPVRGSKLLGQGIYQLEILPSATFRSRQGYDAAGSGGSNLGPTSRKLKDEIKDRISRNDAD